jgi:hypothetical protein
MSFFLSRRICEDFLLYLQCLRRAEEETGHVPEPVAEDILAAAKTSRGGPGNQTMILPETVNWLTVAGACNGLGMRGFPPGRPRLLYDCILYTISPFQRTCCLKNGMRKPWRSITNGKRR